MMAAVAAKRFSFITNSVKVVVPRSGCSFGAVGGLAGRWSEPSPRSSITMRELNERREQAEWAGPERGRAVHRWPNFTADGVSHLKPPKANRMLLLRTHHIFFLLIGSSSRLPSRIRIIIHSPTTIITLILYLSFGGWEGKEGGVNRSFVPFLSFIPLRFLFPSSFHKCPSCPLLFLSRAPRNFI